MQAINDFILAAAGQPWVLALVFACCVIDGFFRPFRANRWLWDSPPWPPPPTFPTLRYWP